MRRNRTEVPRYRRLGETLWVQSAKCGYRLGPIVSRTGNATDVRFRGVAMTGFHDRVGWVGARLFFPQLSPEAAILLTAKLVLSSLIRSQAS